MLRPIIAPIVLALIAVSAVSARGADAKRFTLQTDFHGKTLEGTPLFSSDAQVMLLARDGKLWDIKPQEAKNSRKTSNGFSGFSAAEMRAALEREFAGKLEITGTGHYLVAHPRNQGSQWAARFEELYRSFVHYFKVRGFNLREPQFPLVAVVWPKQEDYFRYAISDGERANPNVLGYYSPRSNRITLYDVNGGIPKADWSQNAATIIHEATHQTAFNTGIHNRFSATPKWVVEGLGTLFEAPAIWDSRNPRQSDRVNRGRLMDFKHYAKSHRKPMAFVDLISSDRLFDINPMDAYAEAWALTYFLVETDGRRFSEYLTKVSARPDFVDYPSAQRLKDFTSVFGDNFPMLESHYLRFIEQAK